MFTAIGLAYRSITSAGLIDYPELTGEWLGIIKGVLVSTLVKNLLAGIIFRSSLEASYYYYSPLISSSFKALS